MLRLYMTEECCSSENERQSCSDASVIRALIYSWGWIMSMKSPWLCWVEATEGVRTTFRKLAGINGRRNIQRSGPNCSDWMYCFGDFQILLP